MKVRNLARYLPRPLKQKIKSVLEWKENPKRIKRRQMFAMSYYIDKLKLISEWQAKYTEESNFYYKLTPNNRDHLAQLLSCITNAPYESVVGYFEEIENDKSLREHILMAQKNNNLGSDIQVEYGRRIGWYAFVRVLKPKIVIETGVDHGVGACILASALLRNAREGALGKYFGTEIRKEAGQLFGGEYATVGEIIYGDSIESLSKFSEKIDLFINDSDHSATYEYDEYGIIKNKLSNNAVILGDNAHVTDSLSKFSRENNRKFIFFSEKPLSHWYPGAGIGISFVNRIN